MVRQVQKVGATKRGADVAGAGTNGTAIGRTDRCVLCAGVGVTGGPAGGWTGAGECERCKVAAICGASTQVPAKTIGTTKRGCGFTRPRSKTFIGHLEGHPWSCLRMRCRAAQAFRPAQLSGRLEADVSKARFVLFEQVQELGFCSPRFLENKGSIKAC